MKVELFKTQKQIATLFSGDKEKTDRFLAIAFQASQNKNLANCSQDSVINSVIQCAQLDLSIDPQIGQAYLVPYKGSAQLQIGYRGWLVLLKRFGFAVKTHAIYNCDSFNYSVEGWEENINFSPNFDEREDGNSAWVIDNLFGVLTLIKDPQEEVFINFLSKKQIEKLRLKSPNQNGAPSGIWSDWYAEMAAAKAIKQHCKKMPLAESLVKIIKEDDLREEQIEPETKAETTKKNVVEDMLSIPHDEETGEVLPVEKKDSRKEFRALLIANKADRLKAFEIEAAMSNEEIEQYLQDPASVETLLIFG